MKIIYINQCLFTYFLIIFHATRASTHWIVTEEGKVHSQDDSVFQMRRPYDLMSLLQQEKRADIFTQIKSQLLVQKEEIETDSLSDNDDDVEQLVYLTNADCIRAGRPLIEFDLYVGTLVFAYPKLSKESSSLKWRAFPESFPIAQLRTASSHKHLLSRNAGVNVPAGGEEDNLHYFGDGDQSLHVIACSNTSARAFFDNPGNANENEDNEISSSVTPTTDEKSPPRVEPLNERNKFGPNCSDYLTLDFSMTTFEHLPSVRDRKQLNIEAEQEILRIFGKWATYEEFGRDLNIGLKQNSSSWLLYTLASFYWRGAGSAERAIECVRRALHTSPYEFRPIPLLSLATILHRARAFEEAAIVLHGAIDITPDIPHAHYTLGNIYATLADYNKSTICYENVLKLAPDFVEVKARSAAVRCHANIENALKAQHDTLQKTLEELKDYQRQQELWINYHKKLRAEQAPPSVLLEQRLHYREFKIRQKLESTFDEIDQNSKSTSFTNNQQKGTNNDQKAEEEEELILGGGPGGTARLHLKFANSGGSAVNLVDKIVIELDKDKEYKKKSSRKCEDASIATSNGQQGNDSNEEDSSSTKSAASNSDNKKKSSSASSKSANECRGASSGTNRDRPILIPVTFDLPPS